MAQRKEWVQPVKYLMTTTEAHKALAIGRTKFYALAKERGVEPCKLGAATRWRVADIERLAGYPASPTTTEASPDAQ